MGYSTIICVVEDGIARLTLNRPERLNALNLEMFAELNHALDDLAANAEVSVLVLTGAGRAFCAGFDLADKSLADGGAPKPANPDLGDLAFLRRLANFPHPKVVALNGVAAGGGVGIALAGDIVVAAQSASLVQTFVPRLGIVPDLGCTWLMPRLAGRARATAAAMLGEKISAKTAADWGLIWQCVDDEMLDDCATGIALRLRDTSPVALRELRSLLDVSAHNTYEEQARQEILVNHRIAGTAAFGEAIAAFNEKRKPNFRK